MNKKQETKRKICNRFEKVFKEDGFCWQDFNKALDEAEAIGKSEAQTEEIEFLEGLDDKGTTYKIPIWARADINKRLKILKEKK